MQIKIPSEKQIFDDWWKKSLAIKFDHITFDLLRFVWESQKRCKRDEIFISDKRFDFAQDNSLVNCLFNKIFEEQVQEVHKNLNCFQIT